jgi:hypothetical protein
MVDLRAPVGYDKKMEACIACGKEAPIISERPPFCHDCLTRGARASDKKSSIFIFSPEAAATSPFPRPPLIAGCITCRGCFNRCGLTPGQSGQCAVKRNIAGRMTGSSLRVKNIIGRR